MDYKVTSNVQCEAAGRALSSIITKMIKNSGFPYSVYSKLVESCVNSIVDYGSAVFGSEKLEGPMKVYLKAARAFLGLPKNGTRCAIVSEIGWLLPGARAKINKIRFLHKVMEMEDNRITKKVFLWDKFLNNEKKSQYLV